jgi:hypothetical protein
MSSCKFSSEPVLARSRMPPSSTDAAAVLSAAPYWL